MASLILSLANPVLRFSYPSFVFYLLIICLVGIAWIKLFRGRYFASLFSGSFSQQRLFYSAKLGNIFANISSRILVANYLVIVSLLIFWIFIQNSAYPVSFGLWLKILGILILYFGLKAVGIGVIEFLFYGQKGLFELNKLHFLGYEVNGILMFPIVIFIYYFSIDPSILITIVIWFIIIFSLLRMISISYKLVGEVSFFHLFLYLCTLEIIPMLFLAKALISL